MAGKLRRGGDGVLRQPTHGEEVGDSYAGGGEVKWICKVNDMKDRSAGTIDSTLDVLFCSGLRCKGTHFLRNGNGFQTVI